MPRKDFLLLREAEGFGEEFSLFCNFSGKYSVGGLREKPQCSRLWKNSSFISNGFSILNISWFLFEYFAKSITTGFELELLEEFDDTLEQLTFGWRTFDLSQGLFERTLTYSFSLLLSGISRPLERFFPQIDGLEFGISTNYKKKKPKKKLGSFEKSSIFSIFFRCWNFL